MSASCSKAANPASSFIDKGSVAYSKQNYKEAFKWYKQAADLGHSNAMTMLGIMYDNGEGTLKDPQQAKYWIKKAYDAGNKDAEKAWNNIKLWKY